MFKFHSSVTSIGLESTIAGIKAAQVSASFKGPILKQLLTLNLPMDNVKLLYMHHPFLTTGLEGLDVLVRPLNLPLTKEKDIAAALAFQAEPLLPYPADQAILTYQILGKNQETTDLTLLSARKESLKNHLEQWQERHIEPEKVACVQSALCHFSNAYLASKKVLLLLHTQQHVMTCVLIKEGKLIASFAQPLGLDILFKDKENSLPQEESEWKALETQKELPLGAALMRLKKSVTQMGYALLKEVRGVAVEGIAVTGEAVEWKGLSAVLVQTLNLPLLACESVDNYSSQELLSFAIPIGLAIGSLPGQTDHIDFLQEEFSYPHPWQRLKKPMAFYFIAIALLSFAFYFFSQHYLKYQEDVTKQAYVDLLASMSKAYPQFETDYLAKNPQERERLGEEIVGVQQLNLEDINQRLNFLQKDLQATPDSFPLFANIPRVSDVLTWLTQHPTVTYIDETGHQQTRLQIESFSYMMLKRPQQGKKQDKYQVKIELEFSSPTPKWAREFHDALIAPNDWVDSKGEVKWSSNRGRYKTSFFLKDKTVYPNS